MLEVFFKYSITDQVFRGRNCQETLIECVNRVELLAEIAVKDSFER